MDLSRLLQMHLFFTKPLLSGLGTSRAPPSKGSLHRTLSSRRTCTGWIEIVPLGGHRKGLQAKMHFLGAEAATWQTRCWCMYTLNHGSSVTMPRCMWTALVCLKRCSSSTLQTLSWSWWLERRNIHMGILLYYDLCRIYRIVTFTRCLNTHPNPQSLDC
jgi:hypothetical protein